MLLTLDAGNTNITIGVFEKDNLVFTSRLATNKKRTSDQYAIELADVFRLNKCMSENISASIISSVVPELNPILSRACEKISEKSPIFVGPGVKTGLKIETNNPNQLGADMVVGAVAAIEKYPLPCLVIDLGTATKLFVINKEHVFLGCSICAGVGISLAALSTDASLLPQISFNAPDRVIGKNTIECMQSGTVFGTASMIDGMIERFENELNCTFKSIIATGGYSAEIIGNCKRSITIDENLLLHGLKILFEKNQ